jgi:hypothetical protein
MSCKFYLPWFDNSNYFWRIKQDTRHLHKQSSTSYHFIPLRSSYSLSLCSSLNVTRQVSHSYKTTGKNNSSAYITFYIFRQQTRQTLLDWIVESITRIHSPLNFLIKFWFVNVDPQIFQLCHIFKRIYQLSPCYGLFLNSGDETSTYCDVISPCGSCWSAETSKCDCATVVSDVFSVPRHASPPLASTGTTRC